MQEIKNLLKTVSTEIQLINTSKRLYAKQLAPNFSIFKYIATNETNLSHILADLLNPKGSHQQDDLFLKNFIKICLPNLQCQEWNGFLDNLANIRVKTEEITYASQSNRKMDIYLTDGVKYGICIENKPYAKDQQDQLSDYYKELKNRKHSYQHLVYLSQTLPSDDSVKSEDLEQWQINNEFSHISYNDLVDWLNACKSDCQNVSVLEFINQFIKFIQKQFMGISDMSEQNAIINAMLESNESIISAIKIANQIPTLQKNLIEKLNKQLTEKIKQKTEYQLSKNRLNELNEKSYDKNGFYLEVKERNLYICFRFENTNYNGFIMGYSAIDKNIIKGHCIHNKISEQLVQSLSHKNIVKGIEWLAYYSLENRERWQKNADIWEKINDGSLANDIMEEIDELYDNVVNNNIKIDP
ncbi:PD-(D/E)XK nuclease family protein [Moraxella sp. Tifton1]|uniref:PDDEXK-like family protein n=1 Tax=Moraxella oculi TaxID=2940516 RepID=UPI0020122362|nr:PD-(D/E)XK nuclease family protein [Moraxella sp. Tifton1]MCL1622731.1 PD-(D/E)XK nuclease family protein [Moraxella sp. Tifton1]